MTATIEFTRNFADQVGYFDPSSATGRITCIGAGGIGAATLPILGAMGFGAAEGSEIVIIDPDRVNDRNTASQFAYKPSDLGGSKSELTADHLRAYGAHSVTAKRRYLTGDEPLSGIVIGAVDSMSSRRIIWEAINHPDSNVDLYIDGRIGGLQGHVFTVEPFDGDWYENKWLRRKDEEIPPAECGKRAIVSSAMQLGLFVAEQLRRYYQGEEMPKQVRFDLEHYRFQTIGTVG